MVRIVIDSLLPHAEFGPNDHRKDAPPFTNLEVCTTKFLEYAFKTFKSSRLFQPSLVPYETNVPGIRSPQFYQRSTHAWSHLFSICRAYLVPPDRFYKTRRTQNKSFQNSGPSQVRGSYVYSELDHIYSDCWFVDWIGLKS